MYSRATRYEWLSTFTSRTRTRPVSGSENEPNGSGSMCPSRIVIIAPASSLPSAVASFRYSMAPYPRSRVYSMSNGIGGAHRSS